MSSRFRLETPDIAEYAHHLAGPWELEYEQLEGGRAVHSIEGVNIGRDSVYIERSSHTLGVRGCVDPGILLISSPSQASRRGSFWSQTLERDSLVVITAERDAEVVIPACDSVEVTVMEDEFRSHFRQASGVDPDFLEGRSPFLRLSPAGLRTIERTWRRLISGQRQLPPGGSLCKVVARLIAEGVSGQGYSSRTTSHQFKRVRDCIALWEDSEFELTVSDICQRMGVSERTLGIWFRAQCGLSPYQYLQRRRLNLAHRALLAADPAVSTVTEIAMRFGFHELGRFAGIYHKFFGELPSRTLLRRSGEAAKTVQIGRNW